jgi:carboxypeptidase Q
MQNERTTSIVSFGGIRIMKTNIALISLVLFAASASAQDKEIAVILDQGLNHSQVMRIAQELDDGIGGRLTNSPSMRKAEKWAMDKFSSWGLKNVRRDAFVFGRGWSFDNASMTMVAPRRVPMRVIPIAWTPPTNGVLRGEVVVAPLKSERDFEKWHGKLRDKIVLFSMPGTGSELERPAFRRYSNEDLAKMDQYDLPDYDPENIEKILRTMQFAAKIDEFLKSEGAIAWGKISYRDGGLVHGEGYSYQVGKSPELPGFEIAAEDYRRLARIAKVGPPPVVEVMSDAHYDDSDINAYNIIAEIPGTDSKAGYVMAGAHLDSWIAGDGAADNGAGSAMIMEAARILASIGVRPKRTLRFALWAAEEQGLLGSLAYVEKYLATRPEPSQPENGMETYIGWAHRFPVTRKPGYDDLVAYFNIDNGSGKLRGIYAEDNVAAVPLLREWLSPFASLGAGRVVMRKTGGTDHVFIQNVGIPGFQFIQDPLDYGSRIHHSNLDTFDHLKADDMRQGATVLAGVLLQAADSDKTLPHEPIPTEEQPTDPFKYADPADD